MLDNNRGIALFMVLWVLALLSVIVAEFCLAMRTEVNITRNFKEETIAYYIARAGVNIAIERLVNGGKGAATGADGAESATEFRVNAPVTVPFGQGAIQLEIQNEAGKININRAGPRLLTQMLSPFDLTENEKAVIVDSIMDWRDKDSLHRLHGAEAAYYRKQTPPYDPADGDFESIEELLRVRGITPEIFYGGLDKMVTIYPKQMPEKEFLEEEKQKNPNDTPRKWYTLGDDSINLNAANAPVLAALMGGDENAPESVASHRESVDFRAVSELTGIVSNDAYRSAMPFLSLETTPFYTIRSTGCLPDAAATRTVQVLVEIDGRLDGGYHVIQWWDAADAEGGVG